MTALEPLLAQPRVSLAHRLGADVLIEADLVRDSHPDLVPFILGYSALPDIGLALEHAYAGSSSATVLDADSYLFLSDMRIAGKYAGRALWRHQRGSGRQKDPLLSVPGGVVSYAAVPGTVIAAVWEESEQTDGQTAVLVRGDLWPRSSYQSDGRVLRLLHLPLRAGAATAGAIAATPVRFGRARPGADTLLTGELALTPDGRVCAAGLVRFLPGGHARYGLLVFPLADPRAARAVWTPDDDLVRPVAAPDGSWFACTAERIAVPGRAPRQEAVLVAADGSRVEHATPSHRDWLQPRAWPTPEALLCVGEQDGRRHLWMVRPGGGLVKRIELDGSVLAVTADAEEALVVRSAIDLPPEIVAVPYGGTHEGLAHEGLAHEGLAHEGLAHEGLAHENLAHEGLLLLSPARGAAPGGRMERLTYRAPDGSRWHSWLCLPDGDRRDPLPVLIWCHGGPLLSWTDWSWRWNPWPFVAEGYAVLMPDPPLSVGYGQDAVERGWGRWTSEVATVAAAQVADALTAPGLDAGRLAVMGGSFGGFLALALGTMVPGVRLVVSHAGWADFTAVARASDLHWHWLREYGTVGVADSYREESLSLDALGRDISVLLSHGCDDRHVPVGEARAIYRALDTLGIDAQLMLFPDEEHGIRRPANVAAWYRWVLKACHDAFRTQRARKEPALR